MGSKLVTLVRNVFVLDESMRRWERGARFSAGLAIVSLFILVPQLQFPNSCAAAIIYSIVAIVNPPTIGAMTSGAMRFFAGTCIGAIEGTISLYCSQEYIIIIYFLWAFWIVVNSLMLLDPKLISQAYGSNITICLLLSLEAHRPLEGAILRSPMSLVTTAGLGCLCVVIAAYLPPQRRARHALQGIIEEEISKLQVSFETIRKSLDEEHCKAQSSCAFTDTNDGEDTATGDGMLEAEAESLPGSPSRKQEQTSSFFSMENKFDIEQKQAFLRVGTLRARMLQLLNESEFEFSLLDPFTDIITPTRDLIFTLVATIRDVERVNSVVTPQLLDKQTFQNWIAPIFPVLNERFLMVKATYALIITAMRTKDVSHMEIGPEYTDHMRRARHALNEMYATNLSKPNQTILHTDQVYASSFLVLGIGYATLFQTLEMNAAVRAYVVRGRRIAMRQGVKVVLGAITLPLVAVVKHYVGLIKKTYKPILTGRALFRSYRNYAVRHMIKHDTGLIALVLPTLLASYRAWFVEWGGTLSMITYILVFKLTIEGTAKVSFLRVGGTILASITGYCALNLFDNNPYILSIYIFMVHVLAMYQAQDKKWGHFGYIYIYAQNSLVWCVFGSDPSIVDALGPGVQTIIGVAVALLSAELLFPTWASSTIRIVLAEALHETTLALHKLFTVYVNGIELEESLEDMLGPVQMHLAKVDVLMAQADARLMEASTWRWGRYRQDSAIGEYIAFIKSLHSILWAMVEVVRRPPTLTDKYLSETAPLKWVLYDTPQDYDEGKDSSVNQLCEALNSVVVAVQSVSAEVSGCIAEKEACDIDYSIMKTAVIKANEVYHNLRQVRGHYKTIIREDGVLRWPPPDDMRRFHSFMFLVQVFARRLESLAEANSGDTNPPGKRHHLTVAPMMAGWKRLGRAFRFARSTWKHPEEETEARDEEEADPVP